MSETLFPTADAADALVHGLYRALLGRDADPVGLQHWRTVLTGGGDVAALAAALAGSDEYRARTASLAAHGPARARLAAHCAPLFADQPLHIVDVGAQMLDDERHVYAPLTDHGLPCQVTGFEPLDEKREQREQHDGQATVRLYPDFIGDGQRHPFHINEPDATSSLLPFNRAVTDQLVDLSHLRTVRTADVDTRTLDAVLAEAAPVDFLKLDIQGFELPALRHATAVLARTAVVHCEVSFTPIYAGQALFSDIEQLLRGQGFEFIDFHSTCRYASEGTAARQSRDRLGWGDAIFMKSPGLLSGRDLLAQAAIALFVYDKPSLAEALAVRADPALAALFREGQP
ncbi:FkbM family methyltransferase [Duganella sp. LX20W]|uniref:FkbM family methyltransferase n=1 Tax=Rugamonas brunnea TaxID=2758569 RepID=A0A7W2EWT4_9BURK|nr:FkbM family methyltransferase [Rugamonas brunnea]MBA5640015.1 FkbM family methyltransferase [Rugamonas brunnea]